MTRAQARLRSRTLELLKERGPQSRAELARCLLVSRSTMSSLIASMVAERIVEDVGDGPTRARTTGRPGARVALKAPDGYFVGIDFGRLRINVAVSDANYQIVEQLSRDFDIDVAAQTALDLAAGSVKTLLGRAGVDRREINAIGIGVPGPVDASTGMLHAGSILASWIGTDVPGGLSRRLGLPAYMDNDANLGALAESVYGSAVGARVALYVLLSIGVGLGIVIDGKVFRGSNGIAGELGHVVTDEHGAVCRCGSRGCLEARVSVNALARSLSATHGEISADEMLRLAREGSTGAARIVADAGALVGRSVGDLCNYFNPELVLVGGELMRAGDTLLNPLKDAMRRFSIARATERVRVMPGGLGEQAEIVGTLLFAGEQYFRRRAGISEAAAQAQEATAPSGTLA